MNCRSRLWKIQVVNDRSTVAQLLLPATQLALMHVELKISYAHASQLHVLYHKMVQNHRVKIKVHVTPAVITLS
jgi:hypothetical protein